MLAKVEQANQGLAFLCRVVAGLALIALLFVTLVDVSSRYVTRLTEGVIALRISGSVELVSYLMLCSLLASMAANVERSQVVVEAFSHRLTANAKIRLSGFYLLGFALLGGVLCKGLIDAAIAAEQHGEVTQDLRLPMAPIYYTAAAISLVMGVRSLLCGLLGVIYGIEGEASHGQ